jgi:hypothetical protein
MDTLSTFRSSRLRKALTMVRLGFECETLHVHTNPPVPPKGHPLEGVLRRGSGEDAQAQYQAHFNKFGVDAGWDGGRPEYRTLGPLTYDQAVKAAREVFKLPHKFDVHCAFHIHISLEGVPTEHNTRMQRDMTEYVLAHMSSVPATVRNRWATGGLNHGYPGVVSFPNQKGPFVSHRSTDDPNIIGNSTWEFRCFGQVTNAVDADRCLRLAVRAFRYAHRRLAKAKTPVVFGSDYDKWRTLCAESALKGLSINTVFQRSKTNRERLAVA